MNKKGIINTNHARPMKCPLCDSDVKTAPLKKWNFNIYVVSRYKCDKCGNFFNHYVNPEGKSYTIPKSGE